MHLDAAAVVVVVVAVVVVAVVVVAVVVPFEGYLCPEKDDNKKQASKLSLFVRCRCNCINCACTRREIECMCKRE